MAELFIKESLARRSRMTRQQTFTMQSTLDDLTAFVESLDVHSLVILGQIGRLAEGERERRTQP